MPQYERKLRELDFATICEAADNQEAILVSVIYDNSCEDTKRFLLLHNDFLKCFRFVDNVLMCDDTLCSLWGFTNGENMSFNKLNVAG